MQRMGFATGLSMPSMSEWKAYDELFDDKSLVHKQAVLPIGKPLPSWFPNWEHESGTKRPLF